MTLRTFLITPLILATAAVAATPAQAWSARPQKTSFAPSASSGTVSAESLMTTDRLIVKYRDGSTNVMSARSRNAVTVAGNRQGVQVSAFRRMHNGSQVMQLSRRMNRDELGTLIQSMRSGDASIEYVEPDRILQPMYVPNDALYPQQWSLSDATGGLSAPDAWNKATGTGVVIAGIDGGDVWGVWSDDSAVALVAAEYVRHDIALQLIAERIHDHGMDDFWQTDPELERLRTASGLGPTLHF
jgi:hypothetical protein